jgi:uncharacterized protein
MASAVRMTAILVLALAGCSAAPEAIAENTPGCTQAWLPSSGRVTDAGDLLDAAAEARIVNRLESIEAKTGHQIVVATVADLQGRAIEAYSLCLANHWGIGRKGVNDGVMILVTRGERKARIEIGRGLEAAITDPEAKAIMDRSMTPSFQAGDFAGGITAGVDGIANEIS